MEMQQEETIKVLHRANEAKAKKIRDLGRYNAQLEEQNDKLMEELAKGNGQVREEKTGTVPSGYACCVDLSGGALSNRDAAEGAFEHIIRAIFNQYPDTHVGVIVEDLGAVVARVIQKIDRETALTIRQYPKTSAGVIDLSFSFQQALAMRAEFRSHVPEGPFQVVFIGYDQTTSLCPNPSMEFFQSVDVEIHNVILGKQVPEQKAGLLWQIALGTGGSNIFYLQSQ